MICALFARGSHVPSQPTFEIKKNVFMFFIQVEEIFPAVALKY